MEAVVSIAPTLAAEIDAAIFGPGFDPEALDDALFEVEIGLAARDLAEVLAESSRKAQKPLFVDVREVFSQPYPRDQWLVEGVITRGGIALLGAEPKSCKTWLAAAIAFAVATGTKACGQFETVRGRVAYFFAEDLAVQVKHRIRALAAGAGVPVDAAFDNLFVCPRGRFVDVTRDEDLALIVASCRRAGPIDLLVLDPLRDIHSASEDSSDEMSPIMRRLRLLGELLGCTVAITHHASKTTKDNMKRRPGQRLRGSGAIHGSVDSGIYFGRIGGDDVGEFALDVYVEVKGARSLGRIGLRLNVKDDMSGSATHAEWARFEPEERKS
jgi:hypothetical protein